MLSAAMAALLAVASEARADTTVTANQVSGALATAGSGNITILQGGEISIKSGSAALTINSNNFLSNSGAIDNLDSGNASGVVVDTTSGDLLSPNGVYNVGAVDLNGSGTNKVALLIGGGHTFFGPLLFTEVNPNALVAATATATTTIQSSSLTVQGDNSYGVYMLNGTTVDGNITFGSTVSLQPTNIPTTKSTAANTPTGATTIELDGTIQGNLVFEQTANITNVGKASIGVRLLGTISPCVNNASINYTCGTASTLAGGAPLGNTGAFVNAGNISSTGTTIINAKGGNVEGGSALIIGGSIAGGFVNNGPATANSAAPAASITGNGATVSNQPAPSVLIDPSATLTSSTSVIAGPIVFGQVASSVDGADGLPAGTTTGGYGFINRGLITTRPTNQDQNVTGLVINGASPTYTTTIMGGVLDTGTIQATTTTSVATNSNIGAVAFTVGGYTNIPRIVAVGEAVSASTFTPGTINALVGGPGGGAAIALDIQPNASVPEIDVLQHGQIAAQISTTTVAPDASIASTKTPFSQSAVAIVDASGSVGLINNAGSILALTTQQNAASGSVISNTTHAIDLSLGSNGGATINNSGVIQGDVFFNSGGGGNALNVGNTGGSFLDQSGKANAGVAAAQGTAVVNTPTNYATVAGLVISSTSGFAPLTNPNIISFGSGGGNFLHVGSYGYVNSVILAAPGGLAVEVENAGQLYVANTQSTGSLNASTFVINGGVLGLTISQNSSSNIPVVQASQFAFISSNATIGLQFGSFISAPNPAKPVAQTITLVSAPTASGGLADPGITSQNVTLSQAIPFLFESPTESPLVPTPLALGTTGTNSVLTLTLLPRSTGKTNADGTAGLNLSGSALKLFPYTAAALANDNNLGSAIASGLTVYKGAAGVTTGINIAASQQQAQQIFSQFAPDVSGGARQVAIMITDQATGPVAARQRLLRSYGNRDGEMTLWGEEFAGMVKNTGRFDGEGDLTTYADHGFGLSLGMDAGSTRAGWYGGALTFFSSDVNETLPRNAKTNLQWYMLTGYTDWRSNRVFLDTKLDIAYGNLDGRRSLSVGDQARIAEGKRASLMGALGATTGVYLKYGAFDVIPHIALDGMTLREEGYTETGGGDGFDLQVAPYYTSSLRASLGVDSKTSFTLWDATISPEMRLGYRYDFVGTPVKLKAAFVSTGGLTSPNNQFTVIGPDPDTGNVVAGFTLGGGTDTWNIGLNYDWIRGNNASTTQVGTITLLGRI